MVDELSATLKKEQEDDTAKKAYCLKELDESDDAKKAAERSKAGAEAAIAAASESLATVAEEMKALEAGITELDKKVAAATEQRKAEHTEYTELMASNKAAKDLLGFAKNRLNKFYNPKLYKPPPNQTLTESESIEASLTGTLPPTEAPGGIAGTGIAAALDQSFARSQRQALSRAAPPPPPETFGAYSKKTEDSGGVMQMMDLLVKDLD